MLVSPDDARHLTFATLDELWDNGAAMVLPIKGEPACRLQFDPKNGLLTLATAYATPEPDVAKLKNVGFSAVSSGEDELAEVTVRVEGRCLSPQRSPPLWPVTETSSPAVAR
jgi:hypothetical protein